MSYFRNAKFKLRKSAWVNIPVILLSFFSSIFGGIGASASTVITNGGFDSSAGWTIVQNGGSGMAFNGALQFSYMTGEVSQSFAVSQGDTVEVSFTVDNSSTNSVGRGAIPDSWNVSLTSGNASASVGRTEAHNQETFILSLVIPSGASFATINISGMDNGYWAGVYGPIVDNVSATITSAPNALLVTSLADDGSEGTLRWAINQANATSGGIYDSIAIMTEGTITLTANLPSIAQSVTIDGLGVSKTIVDGNNQYRSIYNNGTRDISISDITFKNGANATGGIVWANNGTFTITNVKFADSQNYAWYQQNNAVTTFESCLFTNLAYAIRSDYGSTPSTKSDDSAYGDRIYIKNSQFLNNSYGLATERFVKIENSLFSNNVVAAQMQGLNRIQVYGSTFNNNGTAIYLSSWIPTSWIPGADNQLIQGNTFTENSTAISFNNYFNNGTRVVNANNSNSWSTARFNNYSENTTIYSGSGFIEDSNTVVTTTTSTTTTSTVPPTTTTTEPETTTTTEPETTTTSVFVFPTLPPVTTEEPVESTTTTEPAQDTVLQQTEQPEATTPPAETEATQAEAAVAELDTQNVSTAALANVVSDILDQTENADELGSVVNAILDKPLSDEQFGAVIDEVFSEPLSTEQLSSVLEAVFDEPISDEKFDEVISAVLDEPLSDEQFAAVIDVLENESITEEQVASAVDAVLEIGVTEDQATELATSKKVLQSIDGEQAAEIFDAVDISNVTPEEAAQLVEAVQNAPTEVRESMESEINVFDGAIDTYVPLGSAVDVGTRRVVVAAAAAAASMTMTVGGGGSSPSSPSSPSGGSGGGGSTPSEDRKNSNSRRRK